MPPLFAASPKVVQQGGSGQRFVTIDFNDVDINLFIKYISELTQKNFIVDREVKGKVTIISPTRISEEDAYRVFESVLEVHGFRCCTKWLGHQDRALGCGAIEKYRHLARWRTSLGEDRVVTQILSLKHANAEEVKNLLTPLASKTSVLISHAGSGMLILTDFHSNISRLLEIVKAVDVPADKEEMTIIPLRHAAAEGVAKAVSQLFVATSAQKGVRPETVKIIPFERTNSLIIFASNSSTQRIRNIVAKMDADVPKGEGNLRVIPLQYANAEELVKVLMNLPSDQAGKKASSGASSASSGSASSGSISPGGAPALSKDVKIVADKETNTLILSGPREEYEVVEDIVKKLDIPRRMVYLEALIMEVTVGKDFRIGVQWADASGSVVGGFSGSPEPTAYNNLNRITTTPGSLPAGFSLGVLDKGVKIGDVYFPNLGAVVNAYKNDDQVNVIATPQILTTDNKKAVIKVGENIPYITSKNTTDALQNYTNYDYKDVGTKLTITPQINQSEVVRLDIGVEVSKLKGTDVSNTPSTFTRTADTTVVVHNEQTVVIGGMIGQDSTSGEYKVPLLGDIPVLGWLFKTRGSTDKKTNLYIFITPHIVENPAELAEINMKKRDAMEKLHKKPGDIADQFFHPVANLANSVALSDMGFTMLQKNELVRAREYFNQALKIDPNNGPALINLATVCEREGKKAEAESLYRRVLVLPSANEAKGKAKNGSAEEDPLKAVARNGLKRLQLGKGPGQ